LVNQLKYETLTPEGMANTIGKYFGEAWKDNKLVIKNDMVSLEMNLHNLPGDLSVIFYEYEYFQDMIYEHIVENEQRFVLWIDCAETEYQEITLVQELIKDYSPVQNNAILMNTIFPYKQLRTKGSKGKNIMIYIPNIYLDKFLTLGEEEDILGRYYDINNKGKSAIKLGKEELELFSKFFYHWKQYQNVFAITKYSFKLIEWYFSKLIEEFDFSKKTQNLTPTQAIDLFHLQNHINISVFEPELNLEKINANVQTPILKLKQLYEKINGKSPWENFKELKLKKALKLLSTTDKLIAEIAYEFGYANPSNFSAAFKKYYGATPQELKQSLLLK
jgi:AraC-like DNA-binding protein